MMYIPKDPVRCLQLGPGVFLRDFPWEVHWTKDQLLEKIGDAYASGHGVLGATTGGGRLTARPVTNPRETRLTDGWDIRLSGTLVAVTPENLALLLGGARVTRCGANTLLDLPEVQLETGRVVWIGEHGSGLMLLQLSGASALSGACFTFREQGEGRLDFEFCARQQCAQEGETPLRMCFFGETPGGSNAIPGT